MPTIIDEGRLRFTFPNGWQAVKYDDTLYYRRKIEPLGAELAAVDFICTRADTGGHHTLLIEVKDFRGYAAQNRRRQTSGELVKEVIAKFLDTLAVLYTVTFSKNAELLHFAENSLVPLGQVDIMAPRRLELVLFMEEDLHPVANTLELLNQKTRINDMIFSLRRIRLHLNIHANILSTTSLTARDGFEVVHI